MDKVLEKNVKQIGSDSLGLIFNKEEKVNYCISEVNKNGRKGDKVYLIIDRVEDKNGKLKYKRK